MKIITAEGTFIYTVVFENIQYYVDLFECIEEGRELPDYFGENLNALWDCLTGYIGTPCEIRLYGLTKLSKRWRREAQEIIDVMEDAAKEYPGKYHIVYVD